MRDSDVRAAIRRELDRRFGADQRTRIVEEMGIWSGSVRIDVAVINGKLHGYEIKSARDTLRRLPFQAELYSQVFDRVTLVAAECHLADVAGRIPDWWGVTLAVQSRQGCVRLRQTKKAQQNPSIEPLQLARLLWRPEALAILERHGIDRGVRSRTAEILAARLAERLPFSILAREVRETLKARVGWLKQPVCD